MQIPKVPLATLKLTIESIKATSDPDHNLRYCPDWTASEVSGRPKKNKRKQSILEKVSGKKGEKKASGVKRARRYCQCCGGHSHVTNECWSLPANADKRSAQFALAKEESEDMVQTGTAD